MKVGAQGTKFGRWRFRYSLRTFLLACVAVSICLGLHIRSANKQRDSTASIQRLGGWVYYDYEVDDEYNFDPKRTPWVPQRLVTLCGQDVLHRVVVVNMVYNDTGGKRFENQKLTDDALAHLDGFPYLRVLCLTGTQATDRGLAHLTELKRLERLYIWDASAVGDEGTAHLRGLKRLKHVHISNSKIGDESLQVFATLPALEALSLQQNAFSDRGLGYLSQMTQLKSLWIGLGANTYTDSGLVQLKSLKRLEALDVQNANVTDAGVSQLADLPNLNRLYIGGTNVTEIERLRAALPNCRIDR